MDTQTVQQSVSRTRWLLLTITATCSQQRSRVPVSIVIKRNSRTHMTTGRSCPPSAVLLWHGQSLSWPARPPPPPFITVTLSHIHPGHTQYSTHVFYNLFTCFYSQLDLPINPFPTKFRTKVLYKFLIFFKDSTCLALLNLPSIHHPNPY
jgi:hypothetical protein